MALDIKRYACVHDQGILFQTVSQPDKLFVAPPYSGSLLSKTHAVRLQRDTQIDPTRQKLLKKTKRRGTLTCKEISQSTYERQWSFLTSLGFPTQTLMNSWQIKKKQKTGKPSLPSFKRDFYSADKKQRKKTTLSLTFSASLSSMLSIVSAKCLSKTWRQCLESCDKPDKVAKQAEQCASGHPSLNHHQSRDTESAITEKNSRKFSSPYASFRVYIHLLHLF